MYFNFSNFLFRRFLKKLQEDFLRKCNLVKKLNTGEAKNIWMAFMIINNIITRCDLRVYDSNYERIFRLRVEVTTVYPMRISSHSTLTLICFQAHLRVFICHYSEMLRMILFSVRYIIKCFSKVTLLRREIFISQNTKTDER